MLVMTVKSVNKLSIPRDTRLETVRKEINDKINHAYVFGGIGMAMNTVNESLIL
ncbi:LCP family protein [Bacillus sp. FJAT-50079]|nr:LCP family protein [Bacillus sp. FJAT-50079]